MNKHCTFSLLYCLLLPGIVFIAACSDAAYEPEFANDKPDDTAALGVKQQVMGMPPDSMSLSGPKYSLIGSSRSGME